MKLNELLTEVMKISYGTKPDDNFENFVRKVKVALIEEAANSYFNCYSHIHVIVTFYPFPRELSDEESETLVKRVVQYFDGMYGFSATRARNHEKLTVIVEWDYKKE